MIGYNLMLGRKELLVLKCSRKRCGGGRYHVSELGPHSLATSLDDHLQFGGDLRRGLVEGFLLRKTLTLLINNLGPNPA